ncbi:hypothetical protein BOTBODRAFT_46216 [Botryobasidium botryosum FD-172 SS1]|uniref:Uncharacterized protein n=1 Tax=Botryobasidium botryosum (strain FD-172 SS1) TaxID=930990 RepID=A0A067MIY4_BOTB1|nr:hypothetical protein BOTBODRAFT_46216 [Botryobasidium botryosum FD-172 SS1]
MRQSLSSWQSSRAQTKLLSRRIPTPSYRHAAPSGPWPYTDGVQHEEDEGSTDTETPAVIGFCHHKGYEDCQDCIKWRSYPQSLFGNWTIDLVRKSGIERAVMGRHNVTSVIYTVDVLNDGMTRMPEPYPIDNENKRDYWNGVLLSDREGGIRARALFIEEMSGPVLQMFGTRYVIEPFFFSSSLNWIPSRYQENFTAKQGDHITITLIFARSIDQINVAQDDESLQLPRQPGTLSDSLPSYVLAGESESIDPRASLLLRSSGKILHLDLLAIHMIRGIDNSTIISLHPDSGSITSAKDLATRLKLVGRSVYWQSMIRDSKDPTFVFLAILWSAVYSWDEALEVLYTHFCWLETRSITTNDLEFTYELHVIRAHLLSYASLLEDFRKSVVFIRDTHNPAMDCTSIDEETRNSDRTLLNKECGSLLSEIERLEMNRKMQDARLQNVMDLVHIFNEVDLKVFAAVNIGDSKAMKRLSYITMIFLPATFLATVFGMNVRELSDGTYGTLAHYVEAALPLTFLTFWAALVFESGYSLRRAKVGIWRKLFWPFNLTLLARPIDVNIRWLKRRRNDEAVEMDRPPSHNIPHPHPSH